MSFVLIHDTKYEISEMKPGFLHYYSSRKLDKNTMCIRGNIFPPRNMFVCQIESGLRTKGYTSLKRH